MIMHLLKMKLELKMLMFIVLSLLSGKTISQELEIVNPKNTWYFGAEIGINSVYDFNVGESAQFFQGGVLAEYYFGKQWSLSGKVKYYKAGVSFYEPSTTGWLGTDERHGTFRGTLITIPFNLKWEFRLYKNLKGHLKLGYGYTIETKSEYINYSENMPTEDYLNEYGSANAGFGFNYFINKKMAIYAELDLLTGTEKGYTSTLLGNRNHYLRNNLISFGVKYNFKNETGE